MKPVRKTHLHNFSAHSGHDLVGLTRPENCELELTREQKQN